jgi:hypothetical protein
MKTSLKIFAVTLLLIIPVISFSQDDIIEINNTSINVPGVYDFSQVTETAYTKYIIKNNRNSAVNVSDVVTPAGFFANISEMNIAAGKKVILYVGIEPSLADFEGDFEEEIIIKTNLIMDIVIKVKGSLVPLNE